MPQSKAITTTITWHEINGKPFEHLPDDEIEVLIYDGYLDSTVIGFAEHHDDLSIWWIDYNTQLPLKNPQFWADVPFPE